MSTPQSRSESEQTRIRLERVDRQVQLNHGELLSYLGFRIRIAVGGLTCLIALVLPTLGTWLSDNPDAGPGSGNEQWNLWQMLSGNEGDPERHWAWLVLLVLAFTAAMLAWTAMDGSWPLALTTSIGAGVTLVLEFVLRFIGGSDTSGYPGPSPSHVAGAGLTVAQVAAAVVAIWAVSVMFAVRDREA